MSHSKLQNVHLNYTRLDPQILSAWRSPRLCFSVLFEPCCIWFSLNTVSFWCFRHYGVSTPKNLARGAVPREAPQVMDVPRLPTPPIPKPRSRSPGRSGRTLSCWRLGVTQLRLAKIVDWLIEPLWKIWKSIGMISNPIYGKIKNVPNHQPVIDWLKQPKWWSKHQQRWIVFC